MSHCRQQPDSRGGRSSITTYTTVTASTTTTNGNNNTRSSNRACSDVEAGGLRARPTPASSVDYREISSAPSSSRSTQSGSIAPPSHTAASSLRRKFGYTPRVQDTNTASATHNKQTNNTATHRTAERRSGSSTCKQSQQPTLVDQSETRQVTSAPLPSS